MLITLLEYNPPFRARNIGKLEKRTTFLYRATYFVRIFHDQVLALLLFHACVDDAAHDTPGIVHIEVDLLRKFSRPKLLRAENYVFSRVSDLNA